MMQTSTVTTPGRHPVSIYRSAATVPFLVAALILILGGWQLHRGHRVALLQTEQDVRYLSLSLAEHIERSIETVAIVLDGSAERLEHGALGDPVRFKKFLDKRADAVKQLSALIVLDQDAKWVLAGGISGKPGINSADQDFFRTHLGNDDRTLRIGAPMVDQVDGSVIIPLSRRWNKPDGSFGGVVVAFLDPKYFEDFYRRIGLGQKGSISLMSEHGRLLLNQSAAPLLTNVDAPHRPLLQKALQGEGVSVAYETSPEGAERIASYEHLTDYPLIVVAEKNLDEALSTWRREASGEAAALVLAATLLVTIGIGSLRNQRRHAAADAMIRASEAHHRLLTENAGDMISIEPTFAGVRTYVSPACRNVVGWEPEEFALLPVADFVHPDDLEGLGARYAALDADNTKLIDVHRVRHKDGRWIWVESAFTLVGAGTPEAHVVSTARDVSDRRAGEAALAASEARFRMLAENTTDLIILAEMNGVCRYVSPASQDILGYEPRELVGLRPGSMIHADELADANAVFTRLVAGKDDRGTLTHRMRRKDGAYVWVEAQIRLIRDASEQPSAFIGAIRDISERQARAEELRLARDEAERASAAKSDFLANMSHEIRTPLNSIVGWTDLLIESHQDSSDLARKLLLIQESGAALLTIVNDILDFSKIEAGQVELDIRPFSPLALIENIASMLTGAAVQKDVVITCDVDVAVPAFLLGDESRLRQVILNLVNNAIKFSEAGTITIGIAVESRSDTDAVLNFVVKDSGIGISEHEQTRLFERFSQADGSITRRFGGTGLGLAICKQLVALMGGTIGVNSSKGAGATFWVHVSLPIGKPLETPKPAALKQVRGDPSAFRLLLVEDVIVNQELAKAVLERWGHEVDVASNGAEAVDMIRDGRYDLVLMDVQMPIMDGVTATQIVRKSNHSNAAVPIIAMTANVLPQQIAALIAAGMDDHVGKPFKGPALQAAVLRWATRKVISAAANG